MSKFGRTRVVLARIQPNSGEIDQIEFGQFRAIVGRFRPTLVDFSRCPAMSANFGAISATCGGDVNQFCAISTELGRIRTSLGRRPSISTKIGKMPATFGGDLDRSVAISTYVGRFGTMLGRFRATSATFGTRSADFGHARQICLDFASCPTKFFPGQNLRRRRQVWAKIGSSMGGPKFVPKMAWQGSNFDDRRIQSKLSGCGPKSARCRPKLDREIRLALARNWQSRAEFGPNSTNPIPRNQDRV